MAAISGFCGGASTRPPNPRPGSIGISPVRKAFRSMPEQNALPAPVRMPTRSAGLPSRRSIAAAMPVATARLTAFFAAGRLMVMVRMPSASCSRTSSDIVVLP